MNVLPRMLFIFGDPEIIKYSALQSSTICKFISKYNNSFNIITGISQGRNLHYVYKKQLSVWVKDNAVISDEALLKILEVSNLLGFTTRLIASNNYYKEALSGNE
ncbi:MAG: hypothetical protein AAFY26_09970, partial [Cyanobacteria bacterium J06638_22]